MFVTVVQNSTLDLNVRKTWMPYPVPGKSTERKHMGKLLYKDSNSVVLSDSKSL